MKDSRQTDRGFTALLVLSTAGVAGLLAANAGAAWIVGYVVVVQLASRVLASAGPGRGNTVLAVRVRRAMARGEIVMHYQPKVSLTTGEMVGVEALARWQHPRRGLLAPADWIAGTELAWTERRFMSYTLDVSLAQVRAWCQGAGLDILLSVNVTPRCFADARFPDLVDASLRRAGVGPTQLQLELTEAALDLSPVAVDVARRLTEMGVGLALDDFGIGHSSMERLTRLPINELKIDRRFVMHHSSSPREAAIVRAAVDLGHALGLAVTAEGVESRHDVDSLRRDGCDIAQGFHYAPGLPADALLAWSGSQLVTGAGAADERRHVADRRLWQRRTDERLVGGMSRRGS